jgi:hypothetical protein
MYLLDKKYGISAVAFCICLGILPGSPRAATFTVRSGYDINDLTPGNGLCVAYLIVSPPYVFPFCTLRAAVEEANALPGEDTVHLPSGIFSLSLEGKGEDNAVTGDLDITDSLTIIGAGAEYTFIDGKNIDRIFDIIEENINVTLKNVTLMNGKVGEGAVASHRGGGGVRNRGNLNLVNVVLLNNTVEGEGNEDLGGGLMNSGSCRIVATTVQGGYANEGGGLYNHSGGVLALQTSTVSNNNAGAGAGASNHGNMAISNSTFSNNGGGGTQYGGALTNKGTLDLKHITFAFNGALSGGGLFNDGEIALRNSIIAENGGGNCLLRRDLLSMDYNLDSDNTCALNQPADRGGVDPGLKRLQNNGGGTQTHGLFPWSPAYDSAVLLEEIAYDQRGIQRPQGPAVDRGAVEEIQSVIPPLIFPLLGTR